jgi:hypothetical protein
MVAAILSGNAVDMSGWVTCLTHFHTLRILLLLGYNRNFFRIARKILFALPIFVALVVMANLFFY